MALETRSTAINTLSTALMAAQNDLGLHETNAAACLALLISEVCQGDREIWYSHLLGASSIITSAKSSSSTGADALKETSEGQWILRNFAYHDVLASVTLGHRPLLEASYLDGITDVVDSCLGVATSILQYISSISILRAELSNQESALTNLDIVQHLTEIEQQLVQWQCPKDTPPDLSAVAYAYRGSAEILLFRTWRKALELLRIPQDTRSLETCKQGIERAVKDVLDSIDGIPVRSIAEGPLVFPLFIAGGDASTEDQRNKVRHRMNATLGKRMFLNINRALNVLEDLWAQQDDQDQQDSQHLQLSNSEPDWTQILTTSGGGLILT
jgi:transcriptional activator protein UGA3